MTDTEIAESMNNFIDGNLSLIKALENWVHLLSCRNSMAERYYRERFYLALQGESFQPF